MSMNELPDDCLIVIFDYLDCLDDLLSCYKVCSRWSYLVVKRTRKVKYLFDYPEDFLNFVYYRRVEPNDGNLLCALFPNLIVADFTNIRFENAVAMEALRSSESMKAVILHPSGTIGKKLKCYDKLEMISTNYIDTDMKKSGFRIKQLHLEFYHVASFKKDIHYFPNLERLSVDAYGFQEDNYNGPVLEKLKMVEIKGVVCGFQFINFCPNLQSAYLCIHNNVSRLPLSDSPELECLQDLVIFCNYLEDVNWYELIRGIRKFPNLKHLALRFNKSLNDEHIMQLIPFLPNLVLLYVCECPSVTQSAADYVQDYCKRYGRSIKFYLNNNCHEIESDWPQLSTKKERISQGFDFMKHCFLKRPNNLPFFLIPNDY